jgi:MoxR-like ATPase
MENFEAVAARNPLKLHAALTPRHRRRGSYRPVAGLKEAMDVAMLLGIPLLLTGDPGIGKTRSAYWLAEEIGAGSVLRFDVKSDSRGVDLLYTFDEVGRFRDASMGRARPLVEYLSFNALGEAILRAAGGDATLRTLQSEPIDGAVATRSERMLRDAFGERWTAQAGVAKAFLLLPSDGSFERADPEHRVVLIDELDKAPRDTPNDLLAEVEELSFPIRELGVAVHVTGRHRPIVIVTSNSERSLPDPFLRRCAYFDIPFPRTDDELVKIVSATIDELDGGGRLVNDAIDLLRLLRAAETGIGKKPGTSELLAWLGALVSSGDLGPRSNLRARGREPQTMALGALLKTAEDIVTGERVVRSWSTTTA